MLVAALSGGHHPHAEEGQHPDAAQDQVDRVEVLRRRGVHAAWEEQGQHGQGSEGHGPGGAGAERVRLFSPQPAASERRHKLTGKLAAVYSVIIRIANHFSSKRKKKEA